MSVILNEREHAESALENYVLSKKPTETLSCVAKLYRSEGFRRKDIEEKLEDFLLRCEPNANIVKWQDSLARLAKGAEKYPLVEVKHIMISKKEIALCNSLNSKLKQRLLFTLICFAKFANKINIHNNNWVNRQDKEIFKAANIKVSIKRQSLMLNELREAGLIKFSKKVDNININVLCVDNDEEPEMRISDFRNLGYQFSKYNGESYLECHSCGLTVPKNSNHQKYCSECYIQINRKTALKNWHKTHNSVLLNT